MKKHLFLFALPVMALLFASCEKEKSYKLDVNTESLTFLAEGAVAQTVTVTAENVEWEPELVDASTMWLHLEKKDGAISVTVDDNPATTERVAKFIVKSNVTQAPSKEVTVTQGGNNVTLDADPQTLNFAPVGVEAQTVTVTANVEWEAELKDAATTWLHLEKLEGAVSVTVDDNSLAESREAKFTITGIADSGSIEITVTQGGLFFNVEPTELAFEPSGGTESITVEANIEWSVESKEQYDWISVEKVADGVQVIVEGNMTVESREGTLIVKSDIEGLETEITVTQRGSIFKTAIGSYWRDYYEIGVSNFDLTLFTGEVNEWGEPLSGGYYVYLDFFSETPADEFNPDIAAGTYEVKDSWEKFAVIPGSYVPDFGMYQYSYFQTIDDEMMIEDVAITGGTFTVERNGANYTILFNLELSDGSLFEGSYEGAIDIPSPFWSTLTEDLAIEPTLNAGNIFFCGDFYENESYNWLMIMWTPDVYMDESGYLQGNGHIIQLELSSRKEGDGLVMPSDTYIFKNSHEAGTVFTGRVGEYYSMYMELIDGYTTGAQAPLVEGTMEATWSDGIYKMEFATKDDLGYNITAEFEGPLEYYDYQFAPPKLPVAKPQITPAAKKPVATKSANARKRVRVR